MGILDMFKKKQPEQDASVPDELAQAITEHLPYPYKVMPSGLTSETLMNIYQEVREKGLHDGFTPVFVPADDVLEEYFCILEEDSYSVEKTLQQAAELNGKEVLEKRLEDFTDPEEGMCDINEPDFVGELSGGGSMDTLSVLETIEGTLLLFLLPTDKPWEAAAYIPFGGWNDCPSPEEMTAILRYWYETWGAVPAVITHDVLEMVLPSPIPDGQVWDVAKEHFAVTTDCVFQGVG
ncbi:MAG: DUF4253 domain-containing protein, partial [Oscillospiraceae bacterium]|nr:DUF4253 domain-containing protein [Oscillospiraceae bacterium]